MASIYQDKASKVYHIHFRFGKPAKQFHKSLDTTDQKDAEASKGRIEDTLRAIKQGWVNVPPNADFWQFVFSGRKLENEPSVEKLLTLERLFARYEQDMPPGTMEVNSLDTCKLHQEHLRRVLGAKEPAQALTNADLQGYVNKRARESYRGRLINARTIKKEVATFRAVWNWAVLQGLLTGLAPTRGLKYEKGDEKPPFMTLAEIERRIVRGGVAQKELDRLCDSLFLDTAQVADLLGYVKEHAVCPFVYPMFVFVAHTGARRSEMYRSQVADFDFENGQVCIREKKRDRSVKFTFRHVPMSPLVRTVMREWLNKGHPGGPHTFCQGDLVARSRKRSKTMGHKGDKTRATTLTGRTADVRDRTERSGREPLTRNEATHYFKHALVDSKWEKVKGFHVFRHSFASNLAASGQFRPDVIDRWMGHTTKAMRDRYQHLFPKETEGVFDKVFS